MRLDEDRSLLVSDKPLELRSDPGRYSAAEGRTNALVIIRTYPEPLKGIPPDLIGAESAIMGQSHSYLDRHVLFLSLSCGHSTTGSVAVEN